MISPFTLHRKDDLKDAVALLASHGEDVKVLAGGSELILLLKMGLAAPGHLVDITGIHDLSDVEFDDTSNCLRIGGLVTHRALESSVLVQKHFPLLAEMERSVANVRVRNIGTLAGNLCFADPHSDPATLLLAYDARIQTLGAGGKRGLNISDFFVDYYTTALEQSEILTCIEVPRLEDRFSRNYQRFCPGERPSVTVATLVRWDGDTCGEARLALGCVGPTPIRATEVEISLKGRGAKEVLSVAQEAGERAAILCDPLEDIWGSAEYKRHIVMTLVSQGLSQLSQERSAKG